MPHAKPYVYACSGSSDVGALADAIARKLAKDGDAQMKCLVGLASRNNEVREDARTNPHKLVIDGCIQRCGKACVEQASIGGFAYLNLADCGFVKGECPLTGAIVLQGAEIAKRMLTSRKA